MNLGLVWKSSIKLLQNKWPAITGNKRPTLEVTLCTLTLLDYTKIHLFYFKLHLAEF